jgi:hypothetical protein
MERAQRLRPDTEGGFVIVSWVMGGSCRLMVPEKKKGSAHHEVSRARSAQSRNRTSDTRIFSLGDGLGKAAEALRWTASQARRCSRFVTARFVAAIWCVRVSNSNQGVFFLWISSNGFVCRVNSKCLRLKQSTGAETVHQKLSFADHFT